MKNEKNQELKRHLATSHFAGFGYWDGCRTTTRFTVFCLLAISAVACQKQSTPLTIEPSSVVLYSDGTRQLAANPAEGVTYASNDEFYASVDENGLVTGNKVGETEIVASSSNGTVTIPVTVVSQYSLYPDLTSLINSPLSSMTDMLGAGYQTSTSETGETVYTYLDYNEYTAAILVCFDGGSCSKVFTMISTSYMSKFTSYLIERYAVAGMQNDYYYFLNHDKNVVITMTLYNPKYMATLYMPYTGTKSCEVDVNDILERIQGPGLLY